MTWNADQYLTFHDLRLRPALDLLNRIPGVEPRELVDLGCGPGNLTGLLLQRWPQAQVLGVDSSPAMLERARARWPALTWIEADISRWMPRGAVDLVFSNAALHWVDDHPHQLRRLAGMLTDDGVLAIQMPANFSAPSHRLIRDIAARPEWAAVLGETRMGAVLDAGAYHELLGACFATVDVWQTTYFQVLHGAHGVFDWLAGTTLVPYFSRLDVVQRDAFGAALREELSAAYPVRRDGSVLFPFTRTFMVARTPQIVVPRETC